MNGEEVRMGRNGNGRSAELVLARNIRRGLSTPRVVENVDAPGLEWRGTTPYADVVGLAYVGVLGLEGARRLSKDAFGLIYSEQPPAGQKDKVLNATVGFLAQLAAAHTEASAEELARRLEIGELKMNGHT